MTHPEYHVLDAAALSNEVLGQLHALGYAADARLIVFVRHRPLTGETQADGPAEAALAAAQRADDGSAQGQQGGT